MSEKCLVFLCLSVFLFSCSLSDEPKVALNSKVQENKRLPEYVSHLENLTVYTFDTKTPDTVELIRKNVFESTEKIFIDGYIGEVAVDEMNRVYIEGSRPKAKSIYVFNSNGSFLTKLEISGRGPGEFESIGSMHIKKDKLYVFGPRLQKIGIFSLKDYTLVDDFKIRKDTFKEDSLLKLLRASDLLAINNDGTLLVNFQSNVATNENRDIQYYRLTKKGQVFSNRILEFKKPLLYIPSTSQTSRGIRMARTMPFSQSPIVAVSDAGLIYAARTDEFLIRVYDENGNYVRAFYYPYKNSSLSISNVDLGDSRMRLINENREKVPKTWPALHTIEIDDEDRLWVSTITESDSTFQWWVLDEEGKLLARFERLGKRSERTVRIPPMIVIKNGYWYSRERDISKGIDRIVKYKIVFKER